MSEGKKGAGRRKSQITVTNIINKILKHVIVRHNLRFGAKFTLLAVLLVRGNTDMQVKCSVVPLGSLHCTYKQLASALFLFDFNVV